jgi:hypothetical protein
VGGQTVPKEMERGEIAAVAEKTKQDSRDIKVSPYYFPEWIFARHLLGRIAH